MTTAQNPIDLAALPARVVSRLRETLHQDGKAIALHEPSFRGNEWRYLKDCLDSTYVSSVGEYVNRFEEMLAEFTGARFAIAVVNGTAALHLALKLAGVVPGDEVIVPALTFVATTNAVAYTGALPHLAESEETTLGLNLGRLEAYLTEIAARKGDVCVNRRTGRPIRAALPVHIHGHPVDMDYLSDICQRFGLALVEDAAEALGSYFKERHLGNWGRLATLSFNGNKIITTGGGGAILTNDEELGRLAKHLTTTAKVSHPWEYFHDRLGFNYRMPNINAALGCAQMESLPTFVEEKRVLAERYQAAFRGMDGLKVFQEPEFAKSNYWLNSLVLDNPDFAMRDAIIKAANESGIMTRPIWKLMHRLPMYQNAPRMDLSDTEALEARLISIPSSPGLWKSTSS